MIFQEDIELANFLGGDIDESCAHLEEYDGRIEQEERDYYYMIMRHNQVNINQLNADFINQEAPNANG